VPGEERSPWEVLKPYVGRQGRRKHGVHVSVQCVHAGDGRSNDVVWSSGINAEHRLLKPVGDPFIYNELGFSHFGGGWEDFMLAQEAQHVGIRFLERFDDLLAGRVFHD
jgi:hypothetical protein